ncbi:hypothetical protein GCM10009101_10330 [Brevundimonas lenta]
MALYFPLIPAKAGTQFFGRTGGDGVALKPIPPTSLGKHWVPAFAGMSGLGGAGSISDLNTLAVPAQRRNQLSRANASHPSTPSAATTPEAKQACSR